MIDRSRIRPIPDTAKVFVATIDDRIAGMIVCHEPKDGVMPISNLFVLEQYRQRGIGSALLESAIAYAGPKNRNQAQRE
jgi:GNAT superfamily N-acetyltransferase